MPRTERRVKTPKRNDFCGFESCNLCFETVVIVNPPKPRAKRIPKATLKVIEPTIAEIQAQVESMRASMADCLDSLLMQPATLSEESIVTSKDYNVNPSMHVYMNDETEKYRRD